MPKPRKRVKPAPEPLSKEAQRVQDDKSRIARELAAVRRVNALARSLQFAAANTESRLFVLGRELVTSRGYHVVAVESSRARAEEREALIAKVEELEARLSERGRAASPAGV
jgi:hypothetical protein